MSFTHKIWLSAHSNRSEIWLRTMIMDGLGAVEMRSRNLPWDLISKSLGCSVGSAINSAGIYSLLENLLENLEV
jgi:hypothetical protein